MLKAHVRMEDMILLSGSLRGPIPPPSRNSQTLGGSDHVFPPASGSKLTVDWGK